MAHLALSTGTYAAASARIGKRERIVIGNNTILRYDGPDAFAVRLHATNVLTFTADGWTIIRSGGWETPTTSDRINQLLPAGWRVAGDGKGSRGRGWGLYRTGTDGWARIADFTDGIAVRSEDGDLTVGHTISRWGNDVEALFAEWEVDAKVIDAESARAAREAKRAIRLAREHAKGEAGDYGTAGRYNSVTQTYETVQRYHPHTYDGRQYDCVACKALPR